MTRMMWHSNAPYAPTGYGNQTAAFMPFLKEDYELAISTYYGLEGARLQWDGVPLFPGLGGTYGDELIVENAAQWFGGNPRGGLVITLMDVWVLDPLKIAQLNAACWVPVDHEPAPPRVQEFFIESGAIPIAMSKFGERLLGRLDPLYVPHGIDTSVFRPHEQREVRRELGVPEKAFLVGMVAANKGRPSRKGFQQALSAFRMLLEKHDDVYFYLHTVANPAHAQGEDLPALIQGLELPKGHILIADQYRMQVDPIPGPAMAKVYSTLDCLVNPALGEGFGIPVIEAQACGIPAIVTNFSAMTETCGSGWPVACRPLWTGQNSWMATPDVEEIYRAMEECYALSHKQKAEMGRRARQHALKYDVKVVYEEHWRPALRIIEQRFASQNPIVLPRRQKVEVAA